MTCSIPLPHPYSSTHTTSHPVPLWPPQRPPPHPPSQRPARSHTLLADNARRRIIQPSCRHPLPRLSLPSPTIGLPGSPDLTPAGPSLSLRTRVPGIAMRPSEGFPNAHNTITTNLAPLRTSLRMKHPPVCHLSFAPTMSVSLILPPPSCSAAEVHAQTAEVGPFCMATLLHRFHSEGSG